jgi:uncharacterized protein
LWLIETDVFQLPQLHKHFNVTRHFKMTHPNLLSIFTLLFLTAITNASGQSTSNVQKTENKSEELAKFRKVFWDTPPKPVGFINDYENLFSDKEEVVLDSLIKNFEKRTTIQIAVITFDTTLTSSDSLDALTLRLANLWGVGQKDKNNGVVIGISKGYRKIRIQNGYGIEKILTDADTKVIMDTAFIPHFRKANYFKGTLNGLKALMATLVEKSQ